MDKYVTYNPNRFSRFLVICTSVLVENWRPFTSFIWGKASFNSPWPNHDARRKALKLCQLFSILQGHSEFPDLPISKRASPYLNCIRSTNSATLTQTFAHTSLFQNSFSQELSLKSYIWGAKLFSIVYKHQKFSVMLQSKWGKLSMLDWALVMLPLNWLSRDVCNMAANSYTIQKVFSIV